MPPSITGSGHLPHKVNSTSKIPNELHGIYATSHLPEAKTLLGIEFLLLTFG